MVLFTVYAILFFDDIVTEPLYQMLDVPRGVVMLVLASESWLGSHWCHCCGLCTRGVCGVCGYVSVWLCLMGGWIRGVGERRGQVPDRSEGCASANQGTSRRSSRQQPLTHP